MMFIPWHYASKKNNYTKGHWAEKIALVYLLFHGYRYVAKNYITGKGTHAGEIDLIVSRKNTIVFVEVKTRQSFEQAAYAILPKQQQRIRLAAEAFLAHYPQWQKKNVRFDAVLVCFPLQIHHLKNAF